MTRVLFGTLLLVLVCLTFTLPSARSDDGQTLTLRYVAWNIDYRLSEVNVKPGQVVNLDISLTPNVLVYDLRLEALSSPVPLLTDHVWGFKEIKSGELQRHTFQVKIPENAATGTTYNLDLLIQGYNDAPSFDFFGWRPHGLLWWAESPQYTEDTRQLQGQSIVLIVS